MIKYGLISSVDSSVLERTIDLIFDDLDEYGEVINITEIGVFDGQTARGIYEYVTNKEYAAYDIELMMDANHNYECNYTAIDNEKDKPILKPFPECNLIIGNSNEVYNQIEDNSQHLIFVDGCHCFAYVVSDFFCYAQKVKVGGYMAFHDTGKHIKPFKDFQHGDKANPDAYISVRKALNSIGLLHDDYDPLGTERLLQSFYKGNYKAPQKKEFKGWQLIFDEADPTDDAGGICVFRKLY